MPDTGSGDSTNSLDVVVLTFRLPYQVELFDATARHLGAGFPVYYLHRTHPTRNWRAEPNTQLAFFNDEPAVLQCARRDFATARFAVFNTYSEKPAPALLKLREIPKALVFLGGKAWISLRWSIGAALPIVETPVCPSGQRANLGSAASPLKVIGRIRKSPEIPQFALFL